MMLLLVNCRRAMAGMIKVQRDAGLQREYTYEEPKSYFGAFTAHNREGVEMMRWCRVEKEGRLASSDDVAPHRPHLGSEPRRSPAGLSQPRRIFNTRMLHHSLIGKSLLLLFEGTRHPSLSSELSQLVPRLIAGLEHQARTIMICNELIVELELVDTVPSGGIS